MRILTLLGCPPASPTLDGTPTHTGDHDTDATTDPCSAPWTCDDLGACFGANAILFRESGDFRTGTALTVSPASTPPVLVVTAPGSGSYTPDLLRGSTTWFFDFPEWTVGDTQLDTYGAPIRDLPLDDGAFPPPVPRVGAGAIAPGDVTGDGIADLVLLEDTAVGEEFGNVLVFPGPLTGPEVLAERGYDDPDTIALHVPGVTHGVPCGDLNDDGVADLCLSTGVILGPVDADSTIALPLTDVVVPQNAPAPDGGFALWTPGSRTLAWVSGLDAASQLVRGDASGVLDGDPFAWSVTIAEGGPVALFATGVGATSAVHGIRIGDAAPFLSLAVDRRPENLAFADVTGDGVEDVPLAAGSTITVLDGRAGQSDEVCVRGTVEVPHPDSGLGEAMRVTELHGGGAPELVVGAPRQWIATDGGPGAVGAAYVMRLPLDLSELRP